MDEKSCYQFQIIDFISDDIPIDDSEKHFVITFYGKTKDHKNIACSVIGFKPFFYMRVPDNWGVSKTRLFLKSISSFARNNKTNSWYSWNGNYIQELLVVDPYYNFYGFNYDSDCDKIKKYQFAKISFHNYGDMKKCISSIQDFHKSNTSYIKENKYIKEYKTNKSTKKKEPILTKIESWMKKWFLQEHNCDCTANLYESKIHPMLRFIHEKKIESAGWVEVSINSKYLSSQDEKKYNVDIEINNIPLGFIKPIQVDQFAPFITASFDIECDSSHGDFPNPKKDFKKLAIDIHESYFRNSFNLDLHSLSFKVKRIKQMIQDAFNKGSNDVQNIFTINGPYSDESLEYIISQFTEDFIQKLDSSKENSKTRDSMINQLTKLFNSFKNKKNEIIQIKGDPIIQIGTVFHRFGEKECYDRSIIIIGNEDIQDEDIQDEDIQDEDIQDEGIPGEDICDDIPNVNIYRCLSEKDLLLKWKDLILHHNPDIITGYNIFGFDFDYINKRVDFLFPHHPRCGKYCNYNCPKYDFYRLGRLMRNRESDIITEMNDDVIPCKATAKYYNNFWEKKCKIVKKELSSSGLGDNILNYISMDGRVIFDIQKEIQKGHSLDSYKLDNVSAHFMKGSIDIIGRNKHLNFTIIKTSNIGNLKENDYISINIHTKYGQIKYENSKKFQIKSIYDKIFIIHGYINFNKYKNDLISKEWCLAKDDVSPQDIFNFHKKGGSKGRAKVAKYCIMDCELCIHLLLLLDLIPNNIGMANVSSVPLSYIFLRGQGIKIFSLVTKKCSELDTRIPTLKNFGDSENLDDGFEGAIVLEPEPGIYLDDPVSVLDYASLYPNSIIEKNLSHETYLCSKKDIVENPSKFEWIQKVPHHIISYDDYIYQKKGKTIHKIKADTQTTCYFAKPKENNIGIIPTILRTLLDERKKTRSLIKKTDNEDKKKVLDGLQLAYKVTANSVYGQMGAKTSSIFFKKIAACTTSIGRERIYDAESGVKEWAIEKGFKPPEVVYGDTDSVFVKFSRKKKNENGEWETLQGKEALQYCIDCGIKAGEWITEKKFRANGPQDLEYEKTFYPFILISKKRYTGDKYEYSAHKLKERTSMGIVMKRRDNAPIVKYVFGNVIEIIMNQRSIDLAMKWLEETLAKIKNGKMDDSMFIISKSLSAYYKNPDGIAHKVLADRMAERNPGNKPKPNDRIPFMYQVVDESPIPNGNYKNGKPKFKKRKILQGDRVEHPDFIKEKNIPIDYSFYISNQIMNPVKQVLDLEKDEHVTQELFNPFI